MSRFVEMDGLRLRRKVRAVVANHDGEVLLVRPHGYAPDSFALAGGGVEEGESPVEAMRRELAEELGIACDTLEELPVTHRFVYDQEYKTRRSLDHDGQQATLFFVRIPRDSAIRIQEGEVAEARWFDADAAAGAFPVERQRSVYQECMIHVRR